MFTVSLCVPVYNRADRVRRCIESTIKQTAAADTYEVIVVDDGSTDGTAEAVQAIFDEHGFTNGRVHSLSENSGGASAPRNAAAEMARGEYLFFIDSDDYILPGLVEKIRWAADQFGSDIIYPRYRRESEAGEITTNAHAFARHGDVGRADILQHRMLNAMSVLKAFKRSEWERLGISFDTTLRTGEDVLVTARFLFNTPVHSIVADDVYYAIVDHEETRLTQKPTVRAGTFRNYGDILDIIYSGTAGDIEYRHRAAAAFINRIMRTGSGANNAFLDPSVSVKSQNEWKKLFATLLSQHLPTDADRFLDPLFADKVRYLRQGDLVGARFAVELHELKTIREDLYYGALLQVRAAENAATSAASSAGSNSVAEPATTRATPGSHETEVEAMHAQLRATQARLKETQAKLKATQAQVKATQAQLKASQAQAKAAQTRLTDMHGSTSWRLTAPVRTASVLARKARRAARDPRRALGAIKDRASRPQLEGPQVAGLRLDADGRPEVVVAGVSSASEPALFAIVEPAGHRDARHRLPITASDGGTVTGRLPVPATVGRSTIRLTVASDGSTDPVHVPRGRRRVSSGELRVIASGNGLEITRTRAAAPWRAESTESSR